MTNYGLVIDQERCIGCQACAVSCKQENNVPMGQFWNRVLTEGGEKMDTPSGGYPEDGGSGSLDMQYQPTACQHCENAPCVKVCPVNATYTRDDGIVEIDYDKCIGCRYCMAACPYNARVFNWDEPEHMPEEGTGDVEARPQGVVEKCTFVLQPPRRGGSRPGVCRELSGRRPHLRRPRRGEQHRLEVHQRVRDEAAPRGPRDETEDALHQRRDEPGRPQTSDKMESELDDVSPWSDGADDVPSETDDSGEEESSGGHHSLDDGAPHVPSAKSGVTTDDGAVPVRASCGPLLRWEGEDLDRPARGAVMVAGLAAWAYQLSTGLIATGMRNVFSWGLYIMMFVLFVGLSAGGLIISSAPKFFHSHRYEGFARLGVLVSLACIIVAGLLILPDIGRPERLYQFFTAPDFRSPMVGLRNRRTVWSAQPLVPVAADPS